MLTHIIRRVVVLSILLMGLPLYAQKIAVKSNLLYDLTATLNLGVEARFAPKWTIDFSANYNPFTFSDNKKWKHWLVQPEVRYWFSESFDRHFLGAHLLGGVFNWGNIRPLWGLYPVNEGYRYEGEVMGAGLTYGYHHRLTPRWRLEYAIGFGWLHANYDKYECPHCGDHLKTGKKDFLSVTKAAVSLVYAINPPKSTHEEWMKDSKMHIVPPAEVPAEAPALADTTVLESLLPPVSEPEPQLAVLPVEVEPVYFETYMGDVLFALDSHRIDSALGENAASLDSVATAIQQVLADGNYSIDSIVVAGYASPEGRAGYNQQLSERRARSFVDYLSSRLSGIDPQLFRAEGRGEDWDTFARLLAEHPLPVEGIDTLVQQAMENPEATDRIETQLRRKAGNVLMQQYYPQLRRISIVVHCSDGVK